MTDSIQQSLFIILSVPSLSLNAFSHTEMSRHFIPLRHLHICKLCKLLLCKYCNVANFQQKVHIFVFGVNICLHFWWSNIAPICSKDFWFRNDPRLETFPKHCQRHNGPRNWTKFSDPQSKVSRWTHLFQSWSPDGATCISFKFGHQMAPLGLKPLNLYNIFGLLWTSAFTWYHPI